MKIFTVDRPQTLDTWLREVDKGVKILLFCWFLKVFSWFLMDVNGFRA